MRTAFLVCVSILSGCGGRNLQHADGADAPVEGGPDAPLEGGPGASIDGGLPHADGPGAPLDGAPESADAPSPTSFELFCAAKADARCTELASCGLAYASAGDCRAIEKARCLGPGDAWKAQGVSQGRVTYDATKAGACLDAIAGQSCGVSAAEPTTCDEVLAGRIADGQPCLHAPECRGGICDMPRDGCAGVCRSPAKPGDTCTTIADCDPATAWCRIAVYVCEAKLPRGAACDPPVGQDNDRMCAVGDYCEGGVDGTPCRSGCRCAARRAPSAACQFDQQCRDGLLCDVGECRAPGVGRGAACGFIVGCAGGLACLGRPPIGDDTTVGKCGDRLPDGAPCLGDECQFGSNCVFALNGQGTCRRGPQIGDACHFYNCPVGAFCDFQQVCQVRPKLGESCMSGANDSCLGASLACLPRADGSSVCSPIPAVAAVCDGGA